MTLTKSCEVPALALRATPPREQRADISGVAVLALANAPTNSLTCTVVQAIASVVRRRTLSTIAMIRGRFPNSGLTLVDAASRSRRRIRGKGRQAMALPRDRSRTGVEDVRFTAYLECGVLQRRLSATQVKGYLQRLIGASRPPCGWIRIRRSGDHKRRPVSRSLAGRTASSNVVGT